MCTDSFSNKVNRKNINNYYFEWQNSGMRASTTVTVFLRHWWRYDVVFASLMTYPDRRRRTWRRATSWAAWWSGGRRAGSSPVASARCGTPAIAWLTSLPVSAYHLLKIFVFFRKKVDLVFYVNKIVINFRSSFISNLAYNVRTVSMSSIILEKKYHQHTLAICKRNNNMLIR